MPIQALIASRWYGPLVVVSALLMRGIHQLVTLTVDPGAGWAWLGTLAFFAAVPLSVVAVVHFRRYVGAWLIGIGIVMNALPMALHDGYMPVAYETARDTGVFGEVSEDDVNGHIGNANDILLMRDDIKLYPLADHLVFTIPGYHINVYSPGDLVLAAGVVLAAAEIVAAIFGVSLLRWITRRSSGSTPVVP